MANKVFGLLIMTFIAAIVGIALFQTIAGNISGFTDTISANNTSYTIASGATTNYTFLTGQEYVAGTGVITNASNDSQAIITATNFTIGEGIDPSTGLKSVRITTLDIEWASLGVNVSYDYGPDGYIESSAGRNLSDLILVFLAVAIMIVAAAVVLSPDFRSMLGRLRK